MCGPVGVGLAIAGGVVRGIGALASAGAAARSYQASAALNRRQAEAERLKGEFEAEQYRRKLNALLGTTRASAAAGGVQYSGSVQEVVQSTISEGEIDIEAIKYGAEVAGLNLETQANIDIANSRRARIGGIFAAAGEFISGASAAVDFQRTVIPAGYP